MFDYTSRPANIRKLNAICKAFIAEIVPACERCENPDIYYYRVSVDEGFGIHADEDFEVNMQYNYPSISNNLLCTKAFNHFVYDNWKYTRGFAGITLTILHEMGHWATYPLLSKGYNRAEALADMYLECEKKNFSGYELQMYYMTHFEDERRATEWGMNWLADAQNRKTAKAFEKAFFKCWKGEE